MSLQTEQPVNIKATAWTAGIHILLFILFFLISYTIPASEPIQEMGMEINLGTDEDAYGTDQPMATGDPAPDAASVTYRSNAQQANNAREMMQTDDPDAPAVAPVAANNNNRNNTEANNTRNRRNNDRSVTNNNRPQQQRPRYVYDGGTGTGGNGAGTDVAGTGEGNTSGNGDRGVPGGTAGAPNYSGVPGSGNGGISHNISGRSIVAFPPPDADFKEGGRVIVRVTVNRLGIITNKQIVSASSAELRPIALKKVDKIKFNKAENAPEEQFGNITFVFKTRS